MKAVRDRIAPDQLTGVEFYLTNRCHEGWSVLFLKKQDFRLCHKKVHRSEPAADPARPFHLLTKGLSVDIMQAVLPQHESRNAVELTIQKSKTS